MQFTISTSNKTLMPILNVKYLLGLQTGMTHSGRPPRAAAVIVDLHAATPVCDLQRHLKELVTLLPCSIRLSSNYVQGEADLLVSMCSAENCKTRSTLSKL